MVFLQNISLATVLAYAGIIMLTAMVHGAIGIGF